MAEAQPLRGFGPVTYGDRIAEFYDEFYTGPAHDPTESVALLSELAGGGNALELGIGTGRVALPLAKKGVEVHGIDASEAMVARLRAKPGGKRIPVTIGDFADVPAKGKFDLVFVVFNTFFGLTSQDAQVRCFGNVASKLTPGGVFLMQVFVPDQTRIQRGQSMTTTRVELDRVMMDVARHDPVTQTVNAQHIWITEAGTRLFPVRLRYAWPAELDLMARLAGLRLKHRWADWKKSTFTANSGMHISIYEHDRQAK